MNTIRIAFLTTVVSLTLLSQARADLVGLWEFENAGNLNEATLGTDLSPTGAPIAIAGSGGSDAGAAQVDPAMYYTATNSIGANGGGTFTNVYTLVMDVNSPGAGWNSLIDIDAGVFSTDGDFFTRNDGFLGIDGDYFSANGTLGADGSWHRIVLVFDTGSTEPITSYIDGNLAHAHTIAELSNFDANYPGIDKRWAMHGTFDFFYDNDGDRETTLVSNLGVYDEALDFAAVGILSGAGSPIFATVPNLTMKINTDTGQVSLNNDSTTAFDIEYYELLSSADSLDPDGWYSLSTRNLDPINGGDDPGETWDEAAGSDKGILSEAFLQGSSVIAAGGSVSLGHGYDTTIGSTNLTFNFGLADGGLIDGQVEFVTGLGDMNGDGSVDEGDVNPFVLALTDRAAYEAAYPGVDADIVGDIDGSSTLNLGDVKGFTALLASGSGAASASALPEPSTFGLAALVLLGLAQRRRRHMP